ncbi:restriction endonuclease subunit S [Anaerotruncus sp. DFI.9.16]|uniref:restriction endonuclease subunit S n=1 Tax=Anaerotruncus sp. DFI.9.16 TaxID=2965275 RepID=UPI00210CB5FD|nr:restriction endonuclease subunit S [Anaerotruncus sp. DFI.9.16]MCQ4896710.1 restriction endonuclease subunit S [Anaerotruncus sp. DFI.9.16]
MDKQIKKRIEQIRRGEVPEGYKYGKDGVYPKDWKSQKMMQWLSLKERPVLLRDELSYQLVTVRRAFGGVDSRGQYCGKDVLVKNYFEVRQGDFLISKRQIAHGACGIVPEKLDCAVVSNEYNVFVPEQGTDVDMFNLMMQLPHYKRLFYLMSDGVHIEKLLFKTQDWMKRSLAMPPLDEQQKIAAILTTQDKVIELKEKLLAEKQRQEKYLCQQLLTGKKRLPGFCGEWKKVKLKKLLKERKTYAQKGAEFPHVTLSTTGIYSKSERYDRDHLVKSGDKEYKITHFGDICYNPANLKFGVICVNTYGDAIFSPIYVTFEATETVNIDFLSNYLMRWDFINAVRKYEEGTVYERMAVKPEDFLKYEVLLPALNEQTAIAEILSTSDREISLLQKSIDAEKQKKKALMQLLLTGIVRVKV